MAAIVATMFYFPLGVVVAFVLYLAGISFEAIATFGGALRFFVGLAVWWLLVFAGALIYAACFFPWGDEVLEWPRKK